ncbi:MAG TPA: DUF4136 domain-containing protein [Gemmatimonadales bacterium]|nr:DUF4136 domain-containing protein [Gemmatimonadales bacterium]
MPRYGIVLLGLTGLVALGTACHPDEPTSVAELDVVATAHDDTVNFASIGTYVMPDSVVEIVPPESVATALPFNHAYDQLILDGVATKLAELGYTRLPSFAGAPPDVVVLIKGVAVQNTDVYVSYPWWGYWGWYGWPCCYGPGWGAGYPVVSVSQYDVGTIAIDMWDLRRADPVAMQIPAIWTAALRGLLEGSAVDAPFRIDQAIDRAFAQSPYLAH